VYLHSPVWSVYRPSLYISVYGRSGVGDGRHRHRLLIWREGEGAASEVALPEELRNARVFAVPDSDDVLLFSREGAGYLRVDGSYRALPEPVEKALVDSGYVRRFDGAGRALIIKSEDRPRVGETRRHYLAACDLRTGQVERIYP